MEPNSDHIEHISELSEPQSSGTLFRDRKVGLLGNFESMLKRFSPAERLLLYIFTVMLGLSSILLLAYVNMRISVEVPTRGGHFTEGLSGPVRFVNPILAISQADQDLSAIIYSGLMRVRPDGTYVPDLAEKFLISEDGTTYTFTLREGATFHDGAPVTAADVLFTIAAAQNPDLRSPHRADWEGVTVDSPDARTVVFTLPHAYAPFIENATLGVLPKHLWENVSTEEFPFHNLNTNPVGTGPYRIGKVFADSTGTVTEYDLVPFEKFTLGAPNLSKVSFVFASGDETLIKSFNTKKISALAGVTPTSLEGLDRNDVAVVVTPLPRVFGVFFNESHNKILTEAPVRKALEASINKAEIISSILGGFAVPIDGPIPPGILSSISPKAPVPLNQIRENAAPTPTSSNIDPILKKAGWAFSSSTNVWTKSGQTLSLKLATADEPELVATANAVARAWKSVGIDVAVQVYPLSDFNNAVLRPRDYDAILFGEVVGRTPDLFAFWHSSQRNDPGLNLAMYANSKADALLSKARAATDKKERNDLYAEFAELVKQDSPAIFLYSPEFVYIVPSAVHKIELGALTIPAERFLNIYEWYTDTERVWSFFAGNKTIIKN
jgi:peptide/nickel transport system substrate-binding protein